MISAKIHLFLQNHGKCIIKISKIGTNVPFIVTPLFPNHLNFATSKQRSNYMKGLELIWTEEIS